MKTTLALSVEHRDIGATIATDIYLGDVVILSYQPGTRHEDKAQEIAQEVLAESLRSLLGPALERAGVVRVSAEQIVWDDEDPYDYREYLPSWAIKQ